MPLPVNHQPIDRQVLDDGQKLYVHSIFHTLQGEGPFAGEPAVFVRLAGCNLQCPRCDTDYSPVAIMGPSDIERMVANLWAKPEHGYRALPLVVLTGGEPLRQSLRPLLETLLDAGYFVQIETNGTLYLQLGELWHHENLHLVCSPKTGSVNPRLAKHIGAYKYVLDADSVDPTDGLPTFALAHGAHPRVYRPDNADEVEIYVQPMDVKDPVENARHLQAAVRSCLLYGYRLSVQMHKLANLE